MDFVKDRISVNQEVCPWKGLNRGTRIMVSVIPHNLASGMDFGFIFENLVT